MATSNPRLLQLIAAAKENKSKVLDLSMRAIGFQINEVPEEVFALSHLEELNLGQNLIAELPERLHDLKNLKLIDIRDNPIIETNGVSHLFIDSKTEKALGRKLSNEQVTGLEIRDHDLSIITSYSNLSTLSIWFAKISDLSFLRDANQLTSLFIIQSPTEDISFLKHLKLNFPITL